MPLPRRARYDIAAFGELLGDPTRVAILLALMNGVARPASELARLAEVAPPTASEHLKRLVAGGVLAVAQSGRHRYYRIASEEVAEALEALAALRPLQKPADPVLAYARTCYSHLAGTVGVALQTALEARGLLALRSGVPALSARGEDAFAALGVRVARFPPGKSCLDWTERKAHLGGPLGALLTRHLFELRWLARIPDGRALRVTTAGRRGLAQHFGVTL